MRRGVLADFTLAAMRDNFLVISELAGLYGVRNLAIAGIFYTFISR